MHALLNFQMSCPTKPASSVPWNLGLDEFSPCPGCRRGWAVPCTHTHSDLHRKLCPYRGHKLPKNAETETHTNSLLTKQSFRIKKKKPKLWYCYDTVNKDDSVWNSHLLAISLGNREMSI